jgi:hypothetical protein
MWGVVLFAALVMLCLGVTSYLYRLRNVPARGYIVLEGADDGIRQK